MKVDKELIEKLLGERICEDFMFWYETFIFTE